MSRSCTYQVDVRNAKRSIIGRNLEGILKASGPEVIDRFFISTQLSTKFILLINVKMPTFVNMINALEILNAPVTHTLTDSADDT